MVKFERYQDTLREQIAKAENEMLGRLQLYNAMPAKVVQLQTDFTNTVKTIELNKQKAGVRGPG